MKTGTAMFAIFAVGVLLIVGCQPEPAAEPEPAADAAPAEPFTLSEGFTTPESVLYDAEQDVYFVSNINGDPLAADGNGYISRINAADRTVNARWIDGTAGVTLNGPKGMAIVGDDLWVADINVVRRFNRKTGEPSPETPIPNSYFLNDVAAAADGTLYVSDSGFQAGPDGFVPTDMAAVYRIRNGVVEKIASGPALNQPNGLAIDGGAIWVITFGGSELYQIVDGNKTAVQTLPQGSLDGLVRLDDGTFLISSWGANGIYRGPAAGPFELALEGANAPADIGFDSRRNLVLIPHLTENTVSLRPISK
jgi:sugar lactone lactonase YvrE